MKVSEQEFIKDFEYEFSVGAPTLEYEGSLRDFARQFEVPRPRTRADMNRRLTKQISDSYLAKTCAMRFWPKGKKELAKILAVDKEMFDASEGYRSIVFSMAAEEIRN